MDENRLVYCTERLDDVVNRLAPLLSTLERQIAEEPASILAVRQLCYAMKDLVEAITGLRDSEASG